MSVLNDLGIRSIGTVPFNRVFMSVRVSILSMRGIILVLIPDPSVLVLQEFILVLI